MSAAAIVCATLHQYPKFPLQSNFPIKLEPRSCTILFPQFTFFKLLQSSQCFIHKPIFRIRRVMFTHVGKSSALSTSKDDYEDEEQGSRVLEQEPLVHGSLPLESNSLYARLERALNRLSKWLVAAVFSFIILWRHDGEAMWAAMGSVVNAMLSVGLKWLLNQERPNSTGRSDPGMPSSHAQSIFFIVIFVTYSIIEWLGVNGLTLTLSGVSVALGSYFSWLRVSQQLHTTNQVVVGAIVGSLFSLLWLWSWNAFVLEAFTTFLWVRVFVISGAAFCCAGFLVYIVRNWFRGER